MMKAWTIVVAFALVSACGGAEPSSTPVAAPVAQTKPDPLPSWNDGASKKAIVDFIGRVTQEGGTGLRAAPRADRHVRQRRHALVGATHLLPGSLRL